MLLIDFQHFLRTADLSSACSPTLTSASLLWPQLGKLGGSIQGRLNSVRLPKSICLKGLNDATVTPQTFLKGRLSFFLPDGALLSDDIKQLSMTWFLKQYIQ